MPLAGYNPNDATQSRFLGALRLGETGNASNAYSTGYSGVDLSSAELGSHGFPQWNGVGNTHAAGAYQFQPGTWEGVASSYNLDFSNPQDQDAGAWYLAQDTYAKKTGGDLTDAINKGDYSSIQNALGSTWPSVFGNAASPTGLAGALESGAGVAPAGATAAADGAAAPAQTGIFASIENWFERFGLIAVGTVIIIAALWALLAPENFKNVSSVVKKAAVTGT